MLIRERKISDVLPSEITPYSAFLKRREFLQAATAAGLITAAGPFMMANRADAAPAFDNVGKGKWTTASLGKDDPLTSFDDITSYNNFYEFGTAKHQPKQAAKSLKTKPWTIVVDGACENPGRYDVDDLIKMHQLEERVYRFRCVEAWSMVVPWVGIPLASIIKRLGPTGDAKYVAFETLLDPKQMPAQKSPVLEWPYREGLRLDEAMNPLALMAVGIYDKIMPNQNGAPIRLVTPWKYGFKSIKSIVRISFTKTRPKTSWNMSAPREYGFYSNVNPKVRHRRWSQSKERRLGEPVSVFGFAPKRPTLMFNGYEEEVAAMYADMDLRRYF